MGRKVVVRSHPMECQPTSCTPVAYRSGSLRPSLKPPPRTNEDAQGRLVEHAPSYAGGSGCSQGTSRWVELIYQVNSVVLFISSCPTTAMNQVN